MTDPDVAYPYERLRLACGCHEIATGPGAASSYACAVHGARGASPDVEEVMADAREVIAKHRIVTVQRGGGVRALEDA